MFIQAGDIVKGGRQDRTLTVSMLLPPKSGRIPIASFCVEHGRWTQRAEEAAGNFASASAMVPSRELKLAMQAPLAVPVVGGSPYAEIAARQTKVWDGVSAVQSRLMYNLGADVRSERSKTSLQLSLESKALADAHKAYIAALEAAGEKDDDIVSFVFAVNGKLNSGDVYPSNALFRKMWPKLLTASAIEALGHKKDQAGDPPSVEAVNEFLAKAEAGKASERPLEFGMKRVLREGEGGYVIEAARTNGWVHKSYLAK